jgi:hypothetical protein
MHHTSQFVQVERPPESRPPSVAAPRRRGVGAYSMLLASGIILGLLVSFAAGVVLSYRGAAPAAVVFDISFSVLHPLRLWQQRLQTSSTAPGPQAVAAMNADSFSVERLAPNLDGTILLALRGQSSEYASRVVEVNRDGEPVWEYRLPTPAPLSDVRKLANGDVLVLAMACLPGQCGPDDLGTLYEIDRAGTVVRQRQVPATHHAELLPNGNLLLVDSNRDLATELDPEGRTVWSWSARDHIQPYDVHNFVGFLPTNADERNLANMYADYREGPPAPGNGFAFPYAGSDWTHMNSAQRLANGNTLLSLRNFDLVVEVNAAGDVVWSYGPLVLKHQHCAWVLNNDDLLVADNGNARIIEVNRMTQQIVWQYADGLRFPIQGCAYRLPSGNTLITDAANLRVLEVTPEKQLAWGLKVLTPGTSALYRAWWSPKS